MDQIGRRREEIVIGGGNHFGEDTTHENGAEQRRQCLFRRERDDLAGPIGMKLGTGDDGKGDEESFKRDCANDPTDYGFAGVAFRFGGKEFLIHALIADKQQRGGQHQADGSVPIIIAQHLEMTGGKICLYKAPTAGIVQQNRHRHNHGEGDGRTNHEIEISDGRHAGHCREENDEATP